jgi:hypothetical protein
MIWAGSGAGLSFTLGTVAQAAVSKHAAAIMAIFIGFFLIIPDRTATLIPGGAESSGLPPVSGLPMIGPP